MNQDGQRLLVRQDRLDDTHIETFDASTPPAAGQVRLRIGSFALTANNVTYAVFGRSMHYWDFFPAPEGWGCVPVWGFAEVVASACEGVAAGDRFYGYWPMASHALVTPVAIKADGFTDGSAHRAALPAVYNRYLRAATPADAHDEAVTAVLKPLYATAWLLADFLEQSGDFGAQTVLLSSASSKTAMATAFCLAQRAAPRPRLVGATSSSRTAACTALGLYDAVVGYDAVASLPADRPTLYIDFAGDMAFRRAVHEHWRDNLVYSCAIGVTHHGAMAPTGPLPGPKPQFFFAPTQMQQRAVPPPQGLGRAELMRRMDEVWARFVARATSPDAPWMTIERRHGAAAVQDGYLAMLHGRGDASRGLVLDF